ncbi:MAG: putative 2OG-Fe(II) oxygenase [Woeseiaceae bacterium]
MTSLNIQYLFSTPMAAIEYERATDLNIALKRRILTMEAAGDKYRDATVRASQGGPLFESHFDLFKLPDAEFQEVGQFCHRALSSLLAQVSDIDRAMFEKLSFHYDAWFHVSRKHAFQGTHNHQNASWSGIYCVDPGDAIPDQPLSGVVRFYDPRSNIFMYADAGNEHLKDTIKHTCFDLTHKAGRLMLFPSYLLHEIFPYFGEKPRIVIAFNCSVRPV